MTTKAKEHKEVCLSNESACDGFVIHARQRVYEGWIGLIDFRCWKFNGMEFTEDVLVPDVDTNHEDAFLTGSIRWDGVADVTFADTGNHGSMRFHSLDELVALRKLFVRLYEIAVLLIPGDVELLKDEIERATVWNLMPRE